MPVLVDDDLLFEDAPGRPRPALVANQWLRELPMSGAPSPNTWQAYVRALRDWLVFLAGFDRSAVRDATSPGHTSCPHKSRR
jgi:hypothetical protein